MGSETTGPASQIEIQKKVLGAAQNQLQPLAYLMQLLIQRQNVATAYLNARGDKEDEVKQAYYLKIEFLNAQIKEHLSL